MLSTGRDRTAPIDAAGARVLIVEARFYEDVADELLAGATAVIAAAGAEATVVSVPGALEVPPAVTILLEAALQAGRPFDAAVALGCVIRGETSHYDVVAGESARGLMHLAVALRMPLGNGILTVDTHAQAMARARVAGANKGGGAAEAALTLLAIKREAASLVGAEQPA